MNRMINIQVYKSEEPLLPDKRPENAGYDQSGDPVIRTEEIPAVREKCPMCGVSANNFPREDVGFPMALFCCCASKSKNRKIWKTCVYCGVRF